MWKYLCFPILVFYLFGCSWFSPSKDEVEILPPPKVTHIPQQKPKRIQREIGSLWSDESSWNQMYSPTQTRAPGDIVTVKLNKNFMARLEQAVRRPDLNPEKEVDNKDKKKEKELIKPETESVALGEKEKSPAIKLPETVEVTILESLPRGVYRVAANHGFKPAIDAPYVYIQGMLREREIAGDDTASSDALLDLKFESLNRDIKVTTYDEGDK
jgi:flagellar basal body L-ring protein FlgH